MTIDPVSAVLEGVILGIDDFEGVDPRNATTEDIIKACTRLTAWLSGRALAAGARARSPAARRGGVCFIMSYCFIVV